MHFHHLRPIRWPPSKIMAPEAQPSLSSLKSRYYTIVNSFKVLRSQIFWHLPRMYLQFLPVFYCLTNFKIFEVQNRWKITAATNEILWLDLIQTLLCVLTLLFLPRPLGPHARALLATPHAGAMHQPTHILIYCNYLYTSASHINISCSKLIIKMSKKNNLL